MARRPMGHPAWAALSASLLLVTAGVRLCLAVPPPTPTPLPTPVAGPASLQVAPTHGQADQVVSLLGQGFVPGASLTLYLDSAGGTPLSTVAADGTGYFSTGLILPAGTAPGAHQLLVYDAGRQQAAALYTLDAAPPPCAGFTIAVPLAGSICIDIGALVNDVFAATFGAVANLFGGAWDTMTAPFAAALISTPNFASDPTWAAFQTFLTTLQVMWGTLFVAMFVFGMFARYMEAIGAGSFQGILGMLGRATILTAFLALYNPIMANWVFPAENGLASAIANADILGTTGGFAAIGKALATVSSLVSLTAVVNLLILLAALLVALLCVVVRDMGLGVLAALYIVGPLALMTWLSPQLDFIARWWFRTMINLLLWPVGYALALKVGSGLLAASGWTGLLGSLGALGCLVLLYRVPDIIGSMAGSSSIGGAVTAITDRTFTAAQAIAVRTFKKI